MRRLNHAARDLDEANFKGEEAGSAADEEVDDDDTRRELQALHRLDGSAYRFLLMPVNSVRSDQACCGLLAQPYCTAAATAPYSSVACFSARRGARLPAAALSELVLSQLELARPRLVNHPSARPPWPRRTVRSMLVVGVICALGQAFCFFLILM